MPTRCCCNAALSLAHVCSLLSGHIIADSGWTRVLIQIYLFKKLFPSKAFSVHQSVVGKGLSKYPFKHEREANELRVSVVIIHSPQPEVEGRPGNEDI